MELVSVILPAYNASAFISDALESVIAQSYKDLQIIVIDDGSTDDTEKVVSRFSGIDYFRQPNRGAGAARNMGIHEAKGNYLAFIDADDLWLPEKIKLQIEFILQSGRKWCYCDSYFSWFDSGRTIGTLSSSQGIYQNDVLIPYVSGKFSIPLPATLVHREVFEDVGFFDESLSTVEHTDLWARIAVKYPVGYLDQPLVHIRKRKDSLKQITAPEVAAINRRQMLEKIISLAPDRLQPIEKQLLAGSYVREGKHFLRYGKMTEARNCFKQAIQIRPTSITSHMFWIGSWFEPVPKLFYKLRWTVFRNRKANLSPDRWSDVQ